jgi:hypothetical protein
MAIVFVDMQNKEHHEGYFINVWLENHGEGAVEKCAEPTLKNLSDVEALMQLAQDTFGYWTIKDGRVVAA